MSSGKSDRDLGGADRHSDRPAPERSGGGASGGIFGSSWEDPGGPTGLARQFYDEPFRFDFFQAVRLLSAMAPERRWVGRDYRPSQEIVRFRSHVSVSFPASQIHDAALPEKLGKPSTVTVAFMGLVGPLGALPDHYTYLVMERLRDRDATLRDFLDLFNHRLISLFYRAWEKYQPYLNYELAERRSRTIRATTTEKYRAFVFDQRPRLDLPSQIPLDLIGAGFPSLRYRDSQRRSLESRLHIGDDTLRFYAGLLAQQNRCPSGLEGILSGYFGWTARVHEFHGQWLMLDLADQTSLAPGGNNQLGVTAIAGEKVWDFQSKFCVELGPLHFTDFLEILPPGHAHQSAVRLVRLYAGQQYDFDLRLVVWAREVPPCQLTSCPVTGPRLGWTTWIFTESLKGERAVLDLRCDD